MDSGDLQSIRSYHLENFFSIDPERPRLVVGLMAGTSCDGVGCAIIETTGYFTSRKVKLLAYEHVSFSPELKKSIFALYPPEKFDGKALCRTHVALGAVFGNAALKVMSKAGVEPKNVRLIACQGLTLYHDPPCTENNFRGGHMEMGEPAMIANITGVTTLSDLRANDTAAGGHGAPLSVYVDYVLFRDECLNRAVQNIGGIANVTILRAGSKLQESLSFDTGPGNMVIDEVVRRLSGGREEYDVDGRRAAAGKVHEGFLAELMTHPYFSARPPKTTGREMFGKHYVDKLMGRAREIGLGDNDLVATVTALTAEAMVLHYKKYIMDHGSLDEVILGGGGTHNKTLVRFVQERLGSTPVRTHEDYGIPNDAREAITWAILGDEALLGIPANVPHASGARERVLLGRVTFGRNVMA